MEPIKSITKKISTTLSRSNIDENLISFYRTCMEESRRRKWKVVRKWNVIVWKGILFLFSVSWHHSTLLQTHWASVSLKSCPVWFVLVYVLTACVFVTRDTVRHPRRFVFGKFVRKPSCSCSEAFVNRGLTVFLVLMSVRGWVNPGPQCSRKDYVNKKFPWHHRESSRDLPVCIAVP